MNDMLVKLLYDLQSEIKKAGESLSNLKADLPKIEARYDPVKLARSKFNSFRDSSNGSNYKKLLYKKQKGSCFTCKISLPIEYFEIDHKRPLSIYPQSALRKDNMQLLCTPCNRKKSNLF
jgi:5-methylcytosine-specific restriction endonuclease McrA